MLHLNEYTHKSSTLQNISGVNIGVSKFQTTQHLPSYYYYSSDASLAFSSDANHPSPSIISL